MEVSFSPAQRPEDAESEIPAELYVTIKRTTRPDKNQENIIRWEPTTGDNFPGIRFGRKAFERLYSHIFLDSTDGVRSSTRDGEEDPAIGDIESQHKAMEHDPWMVIHLINNQLS